MLLTPVVPGHDGLFSRGQRVPGLPAGPSLPLVLRAACGSVSRMDTRGAGILTRHATTPAGLVQTARSGPLFATLRPGERCVHPRSAARPAGLWPKADQDVEGLSH